MKEKYTVKQEKIGTVIREFIKNNFLYSNEINNFNNDDSLVEKGIVDSTGILELVNFIEETFNIRIEDEELIPENMETINKIVSFIKRKRG